MQTHVPSAQFQAYRAATPTAPYSRYAPSPPHIPITLAPRGESAGLNAYTLVPTDANLAAISLQPEELAIVARGRPQKATDNAATWNYEMRRGAQQILDYMCIGPTSVLRDHAHLKQHGITMIVLVRDAMMGTGPAPSLDKACQACGIDSYHVNVESLHQLIHNLPDIIHHLNDHMVRVHRHSLAESGTPRVGNILVACNTGNDRSAALVAAYIMAVFGASMHKVVQFIMVQRFCCTFDEDVKRMLQTWQDLLRATAAVSANNLAMEQQSPPPRPKQTHSKRRIDDALRDVDVEMDDDDGGAQFDSDRDRFIGRDTFVPFVDVD